MFKLEKSKFQKAKQILFFSRFLDFNKFTHFFIYFDFFRNINIDRHVKCVIPTMNCYGEIISCSKCCSKLRKIEKVNLILCKSKSLTFKFERFNLKRNNYIN